jgi:hypothetical protein
MWVRTGDFKRQIGSSRGLILTDAEAEPGGVVGGAGGVRRGEIHELGRLDVLVEQGVVVLLFLLVLRVSRRDPHAALDFLTGPDCADRAGSGDSERGGGWCLSIGWMVARGATGFEIAEGECERMAAPTGWGTSRWRSGAAFVWWGFFSSLRTVASAAHGP